MNSTVSNLRPHYSSMPKIMAFAILDGTSFWVKNAKKKHLLAFTTLNKNALIQIKLNTTQFTLIFCIVICENDLEQRVVKQSKEM